jgi:hypothetical protein
MSQRFTIDGSVELEAHLALVCEAALEGVQSLIGAAKLEGLVLGGGYGRGEGGVLIAKHGQQPYNDLDFYVFVRGSYPFNRRRYHHRLNQLGEGLSRDAGLHVEFKLETLERLRAQPISMFSYDLVAAHRVIFGGNNLFADCQRHLQAGTIPKDEATRLLFNRCSGLLLAKALIHQRSLSPDDSDFIGRNLAKAQLALGDALLTALGQYHWSVLERHRRLQHLESEIQNLTAKIEPQTGMPPQSNNLETLRSLNFGLGALGAIQELRRHHAAGLEFKLHPRRVEKSSAQFCEDHREIAAVAQRLWLWVESRRLLNQFSSVEEYALSAVRKCCHSPPARNLFLNLRTFGPGALLDAMAWRYPRERLFNSLNLLLWNDHASNAATATERQVVTPLTRFLQKQLRTSASEWGALVAAYQQVWPSYG